MDVIDLATKIGNLGGLAVFAYYVLAELREQRREARRRQAVTDLKLDALDRALAVLLERTSTEMLEMPVSRSQRHIAPVLGVEVTAVDRPPRRKRTLSDDPDDGDE